MEELERFRIADDSGTSALHIIQVRKIDDLKFRLFAVPSFPIPFNPLLLSYVCFIDSAGRLQANRSMNYFLLAGCVLLIAILTATAFSDKPSDQRELPWLFAVTAIYAIAKISGMMTLHSYVRKLQTAFDRREL